VRALAWRGDERPGRDGALVASGAQDNKIRLWRVERIIETNNAEPPGAGERKNRGFSADFDLDSNMERARKGGRDFVCIPVYGSRRARVRP
jgi:hypothetical protein